MPGKKAEFAVGNLDRKVSTVKNQDMPHSIVKLALHNGPSMVEDPADLATVGMPLVDGIGAEK